ncbi:hypothetical protein ACLIJR_06025 [Hydrogenophaga sp. XSHU_21]
MFRHMVVVALAAVLVGCGRVEALFLEPHEKALRAFPLSQAADRAVRDLNARTAVAGSSPIAWPTSTEDLIRARSVMCSAAVAISRLDQPEDVRSKIKDSDCFDREDERLANTFQLRSLAVLLRSADIVPAAPLADGTELAISQPFMHAEVAESAHAVAVFQGDGGWTLVNLTDGRTIKKVAAGTAFAARPTLSANGRVLASASGQRLLRVLDASTGDVVWESGEYGAVLRWLPELNAALVQGKGNQGLHLLDLLSAESRPLLPSERAIQWALPVPGSPGRLMLAGRESIARVEFSRSADGELAHKILNRWQLDRQKQLLERPMLMMEGKRIVFRDAVSIRWFDIDAGTTGSWDLDGRNLQSLIKVNDQSVLVQGYLGGRQWKQYVVDLASAQAAEVQAPEGRARYVGVGDRPAVGQIVNQALVLRTSLAGVSPMSMDDLVAQSQLARQLAELEAASRQAQLSSAPLGSSGGLSYPGGLYRPPGETPVGAPTPQRPPMIQGLPSNARVSAVGVYGGSRAGGGAGVVGRPGSAPATVRVTVMPDSAPLVLVLSSYEAVNWLVFNPNGRRIAAILVSGYEESKVFGAGDTTPVVIGRPYAYELSSPGYRQLQQSVMNYVGRNIDLFQGRYSGSEFIVR